MLELQNLTQTVISQENLSPQSINQFLKSFENFGKPEIKQGLHLNFEIISKVRERKITPILKLAKPGDAIKIVEICKEAYEGTYPYKEMEDEIAVKKMIENPLYQFILFKDNNDYAMGCFKCILDFRNKKGYMGGFMLKKKYHGRLDVIKTIMGSFLWMWNNFKNDILVWYCENRTAHSTSQYITSICGIKTIALLPNKDIFFHKVESDVLGVIYVERALRKLRQKKLPRLIKEVNGCFSYSNKLFNLGSKIIENPKISLNNTQIKNLKNRLSVQIEKLDFGYETISFSIKGSDSYFSFLHTTHLQNFEKTKYNVQNLEELHVFVHRFMKYVKKCKIRYCEVFVSAYKPYHQKLFLTMGLKPSGYVPSWIYDKEKNEFNDNIVFNYFTGEIGNNLKLLPECTELISIIEHR